jgi:succinyl-CoA synthetase beta subunit
LLSFPVAAKIVSKDIPHKSDVGGVRLDVADADALATAAAEIIDNAQTARPEAYIEGVLASEMTQGLEVLVGAVNDPAFGPVITLGLGGIFTEILNDVSYGLAPLDLEAARTMISDLRASKLFDAYRGREALDKDALAEVVVNVSRMALALRDRLIDLDINPVFVQRAGQGVIAADALISLR